MRVDLHLWDHGESPTDTKLDALIRLVTQVLAREEHMAGALDALKAQVTQNTTLIGGAIALIQGLKAKLDEAIAANDPAALQALSDELGAQDAALAAAITANTPSETP